MKKLINITLLLACLAGTGFISSCSKSDSGGTVDNASRFVGSYVLTSPCFPNTQIPVTITANGYNSINLPFITGLHEASCNKVLTIPANVSGNNIQSTTNTVYDACNNKFTVTISGSISGNTLSLTYVVTDHNGIGTGTCNYVGTK